MGFIELVLTGIGLAMDAFAVSVGKGLQNRQSPVRLGLILGLTFGGFQALMPLVGWAVGVQFLWLIAPIDHWIAALLLWFIGGKMIYEACHEDSSAASAALTLRELLLLGIATSIDALVVGISFAMLDVNIVLAITVIGLVTFVASFIGVFIGTYFGSHYERTATIAGGIILIIIGLKILLEHLGVLP